ncbi:hypothetical protein RIF29_25010 [Crotalaria pallida]|uniref:Uncharacterized protein n=1 Tax=Crotalaria pallida TaxID=3830 RepID=A0AAN9HX38_CROPI
MATKTLEDSKPQPEPPLNAKNDDVASAEPKPEPAKAESSTLTQRHSRSIPQRDLYSSDWDSKDSVRRSKRQKNLEEDKKKQVGEGSSSNTLPRLLIEHSSFENYILHVCHDFLQLEGTENSVYLDMLRLFAYGTWSDYKRDAERLPQLIPDQILKLNCSNTGRDKQGKAIVNIILRDHDMVFEFRSWKLISCNCIMVLVKKFKWLTGSAGRLPQLIPDQILKLKQLTVLTLADIDKAKDKMEKSVVADNDSGKSIASEVRTSSGMFLNKAQV